MATSARFSLMARLGEGVLCAISLEHVVETLRPLPTTPLAGAPPGVIGVSVVRGVPVPVVDGALLAGGSGGAPTRWVILRAGDHHVGLAVQSIAGCSALADDVVADLPPLVGQSQIARGLGAIDSELLLVLDATRLVPEGVFATQELRAVAS